MTVSSTNTKNSYSGDASTTVFAYTFKIFDDDDVQVILRTDSTGGETVQTKGTDYSVSGVGNAGGGNVTFVTAPASGITVVLIRATVQTQTTDYTPNDPFPAASHEEALDRLTLMVQDQQEELDRSIKVSRTNTISSSEFTIGATDRANKVFAFDGNGDFAVTQEIGTYKGTDATTTTSAYSARDIVKSTTAAQLDNVYIATQNSPAGTLLTNTTYWQLLIDAVAAATSAAAAASSATDAETAQTAAETAQAAAETAETNAETAETNAETAETNAETAQAAAEAAQTGAETAETNAGTSEANAATSATASASSATASAASATASAASETAAAASEAAAATSETNAGTSETNAATSAATATTQAGIATTKAGEAATSATNAATSETNAATSATSASASQVAAAASAASAASAFDNFDDTYLGSYATDPTVDNDGDALVQGALYFNTTANEMRVYDGGSWIAASSAGGASLLMYEYTATAAQTTFSGADDNANTLSYTIDNIIVTLNGIVLDPSDYTATSGTSIVLASGAALNDELNVVAFKSFTTADMVSATNGGTFGNSITVTGTVTADGLTVDTNTLYVDSTNNRVGIGTVTPSVELEISSSAPQMRLRDTDTNAVFQINGSATNGSVEIQADATGVGSNPSIQFDVAGTEQMRIDSDGHVIAPNGITLGTAVGTYNAANTLHDYEEGTWTPVADTNSGSAATFGSVQGHYTKIGNLVYVRGYAFNIDTTGTTSTSTLRVVGLPFSVDIGNTYGAAYVDNFTYQTSRTQINSVFSTSNYMQFTQSGGSAGDTATDHGDVDAATSDVFFSGFYFTLQ